MIEILGQSYTAVVGSDVDRDGMYLELSDSASVVIAEVFYSDDNGSMTFTSHQTDLPVPVVEWLIAQAKLRLVGEEPMNLAAAARAAVMPWFLLLVVGLGLHTWSGMIESYGWPEYLRRFIPAIALLYPILIAAVLWNDREFPRGKRKP